VRENRTLPVPPATHAPSWLAKPSASGTESALRRPTWVTKGPFASNVAASISLGLTIAM
jgi:hypothetical protein